MLDEERLRNHARATQDIYEEVQKTVIERSKEEEKSKMERLRR